MVALRNGLTLPPPSLLTPTPAWLAPVSRPSRPAAAKFAVPIRPCRLFSSTGAPPPASPPQFWPRHTGGPAAIPKRVHVLGIGSIGKLVAHSLRAMESPPPVTLLLSNRARLDEWERSERVLSLIAGDEKTAQPGFDAEVARPREWGSGEGVPSHKVIHNLVVTVPANATVTALDQVKNRLAADATVLLIQNGMGTLPRLQESLFSKLPKDRRPTLLTGITTHGVTSLNSWTAIHQGVGTVMLGLPLERGAYGPGQSAAPADGLPLARLPLSTRYMLSLFERCPDLAAMSATPADVFLAQLEKLAVNCVINPLSVLLDAPNGAILNNYHFTRVMRLLLAEISLVIRALPEVRALEPSPDVMARFSAERLETLVVLIAGQTRKNLSSMLQAARRGSPTEIDFMNGYIVQRGEEVGIRCVMNYMITHLIRGKSMMIQKERDSMLPYIDS